MIEVEDFFGVTVSEIRTQSLADLGELFGGEVEA